MERYLANELSELREGPSPAYREQFRIGEISVEIAGKCASDVALIPSLEPFQVAAAIPDITIHLDRVPKLPVPAKPKLFDSSTTWRLYECGSDFQFDFSAAIFGQKPFKRLLIDNKFRHAILQMSEECIASLDHFVEPLAYPLD